LALIVARRQLIICQRDSQRNCAQRSLFGVNEWRRQRLSAGPRAASQILRLISTSTATTLEFYRFGADRRAVCWLPISIRAPRLERRHFAPTLFHFAFYEQLRNAICVITRKKGGARL